MTKRKTAPNQKTKAAPKAPPKRVPRPRRPKPDRARFAAEYLVDLNATQAAIRCGYAPKAAYSQGARLLKTPQIAAIVEKELEARRERARVKADDVLRELAIIGLADMRNYVRFDENGEIALDWSHMPEEATRAISEITQEVVYQKGADGLPEPVRKTKFKLHAKTPALNLIAQHLGMLVNKHEHTGKDGAPLPPASIEVVLVRPKGD
jgi:phage terminase small subunit